ncbi:MAG TPA: hypothetical protein V6C81_22785 [Planktothrix sp.]
MAVADVDRTVQAVEQTKSSESSMQAVQRLSAEYNSYSKTHNAADTATYWDNVTTKLKDDNVLPDMAIAWGAEHPGESISSMAKSNTSDALSSTMSNELKSRYEALKQGPSDSSNADSVTMDQMSAALRGGDKGAGGSQQAGDAAQQKMVQDLKAYGSSDQSFDRNTVDEFKDGIKAAYDSGKTPDEKSANEQAYIKNLNDQLAGSGLKIDDKLQGNGLGGPKRHTYELTDTQGNTKTLSVNAKSLEEQEAAQKGYDDQKSAELQTQNQAQEAEKQREAKDLSRIYDATAKEGAQTASKGSFGDATSKQHMLQLFQDAADTAHLNDGREMFTQKLNEDLAQHGLKVETKGTPNTSLSAANPYQQSIVLEDASTGKQVDVINYHETWKNGQSIYTMDK